MPLIISLEVPASLDGVRHHRDQACIYCMVTCFVSFRPEWMKPFVLDSKSKWYTTTKFLAWISLHIGRNLDFGPLKKKKKNMHRERGHGCRKERKK